MKVYFNIATFLFISFLFTSCKKEAKSIDAGDGTVLIKKNIELTGYLSDFYSQAISYHWIKDKDTLDFSINIYERKKDSISTLSLINTKPLLFEVALSKTEQCLNLIQEDFDASKINTLYFKSPLYFSDLAMDLSTEYEQEFGASIVDNQSLDQFLLKSSLTTRLYKILMPIHKKPTRYSMEQFDILHKENYLESLPEINVAEYPDFTLHGTGVYVRLKNLQKESN